MKDTKRTQFVGDGAFSIKHDATIASASPMRTGSNQPPTLLNSDFWLLTSKSCKDFNLLFGYNNASPLIVDCWTSGKLVAPDGAAGGTLRGGSEIFDELRAIQRQYGYLTGDQLL